MGPEIFHSGIIGREEDASGWRRWSREVEDHLKKLMHYTYSDIWKVKKNPYHFHNENY
jgi:hypothetical protein